MNNEGQNADALGQGMDASAKQMGKVTQQTGQAARGLGRAAGHGAGNVVRRVTPNHGLHRSSHFERKLNRRVKSANKVGKIRPKLVKATSKAMKCRNGMNHATNRHDREKYKKALISAKKRQRALKLKLSVAKRQHETAKMMQHGVNTVKRGAHVVKKVVPKRDKDPRQKRHGPIQSTKRHLKNFGHRIMHMGHGPNHKHGPLRSPIRHTENMAHRATHMGRTKNESRAHRMKKDQNSTYKAQLRARRKNALRERYQSRQKQDQHQNDGPSLMKGL